MAENKPKRTKKELWNKLGRFITGVTIACFFLPFFGVECGGMEVVHFSGTDMVGGCKPGGALTEKDPEMGGGGDMDVKIENVDREPLAIVAFVLALVVAGLSWVRTRGAMIGAMAVSLACLAALVALWVKVGGDMKKEIDAAMSKKGGAGGDMMKEAKVEAGGRFGLWMTGLGLLTVAVMTGLALKEKEGYAGALPPPGPPPGPAPGGGYPV